MSEPKSPVLRELKSEWVRGGKQEMVLDILVKRFGTKAQKLRTKLKAIEDEAVLTELVMLASTCPDLDAFRKQLSP